ncbi:DUF2852 domain-containing protein [Rhodoligotrophos defluvii]|uniref:DUF2852 domain-containing protein n=1 Tax=Rhodoligotrophos defluvii TaxID=2561934 RepID=UPI0010C97DEF|nr:DUF2852 domain-containing protein [Rhodoligotrophos defluvii]
MTLTKTTGRRWTPLSVATLVLGFMVWWPIGLAVLAYILWGGQIDDDFRRLRDRLSERNGSNHRFGFSRTWCSGMHMHTSTGNAAFDKYKRETLRRLEEEQRAFSDYVERLRAARDQEEFDRFMAERRQVAPEGPSVS